MRILHVYKTYFPDTVGGVEESIRQICFSTSKLGAEPRVFALTPNREAEDLIVDGIKVIRARSLFQIASCDFGGIGSFVKFYDEAKEADIIHFHFPWPFADILNIPIMNKKIKVMTYHSDIVRQEIFLKLYSPLMGYMFHQMDAIVGTSPNYIKSSEFLSDKKIRNKLKMIPLGMGRKKLDNGNNLNNDVSQLLEKEFVLFIGVLRYYKGLKYLIDSAHFIHSNIVIAGSGGIEAELHNYLKVSGLRNVFMVGHVNDIDKWRLLETCKAFVLPSHMRSEAFGMSLLEASMLSKPLITCEIGTGTSYINIDGITGRVALPANSRSLAEAINSVLEDEDRRIIMGLNSQARYNQLFSLNSLGKNYFNLYTELKSS